jgi:hypothetical protein
MGFEKQVLETIEPALGDHGVAEFYFYTLFVDRITEDQARSIYHKLVHKRQFGNVEVTRIGQTSEYAYDFV